MCSRKSILHSPLGLLISLLCLLQQARSQSGCGNNGATRTISNQADILAIASCTVFSGSLAAATSYSGVFNLSGVQEILEDLVIEDAVRIISLSSDSLRRIDGNFTMSNVTLLSTLELPSLTSVGTISWLSLPGVSFFDFTAGLSSVANVIISNTFLDSLDGINLRNADNVYINNNLRLQNITLPLESAKVSIEIASNGRRLNVSLPQLTSAGSLILSNVSTVSLPSLSFLSGRLQVQGSLVVNLTADSLSVVTEDLYIRNNGNLTGISFQGLLSARSIDISNNTLLKSIDFGKLGRAESINIGGNLTSINMPGLTSVNDTFDLQSTNPNFNCSIFDENKAQSVIKGSYTCQGQHASVVTPPPTNTTNPASGDSSRTPGPGDSSPNPGLSGGAKAGIAVSSVILGVGLAIGAVFFVRHRQGKRTEAAAGTIGTDGKAEMDNREVSRKELATGQEVHELAGGHGVSEAGVNGFVQRHELPGDPVPPGGGQI